MKENNNSFCVLPWIHLATHPVGIVTPCCITDMKDGVSTAKRENEELFLNRNSFEEITNSELFNSLRLKMMNGEFPNICKSCYLYDQNNIVSRRVESNKNYSHLIDQCFKNTNQDGSLNKIDYRYIELRLGTVCNLKCVTCNSFSSNRWNEDVSAFKNTEFENNYLKNEIKNEWYRDPSFYDDLLLRCENLEEVWINGGEPTLIKEHSYFLEKLIESGKSKEVKLHYSINMTRIPDSFINLWLKFKSTKLQLSIDDIGTRNDYIRYGSDWETIKKNLDKISSYKKDFEIEICQTVSALNVRNINEFKKFSNRYGLVIAHNFVHNPEFMHVSILPLEMKNEIINESKDLTDYEMLRLRTELFSETDENNYSRFKEFMRILDIKRNLNISDYLPEWEKYFTN